MIRRNGAGARPVAGRASRIPAGHPEGYLEAFAQLYSDLAEQILARIENRAPDPASLLVPGIDEGVAGMRFIEGVLNLRGATPPGSNSRDHTDGNLPPPL